MAIASGTMVLALALLGASGPSGRWFGQDGHDLTSTSKELKPSDYQDIHIALSGLPPDRELARVQVDGEGGGTWQFQGPPGSIQAALVRSPRARTADLYFEPYMPEKGRTFFVHLYFVDGAHVEVHVKGGKADPNLRMPGAAMIAKWVGQDRQDRVGSAVGVGPDGLQDVRITLAKLAPKLDIKAVEIEAPGGLRWQFGVNPKGDRNAELVRDPKDRTRAELFFQPDRELAGKPLKLSLTYTERGDSGTLVGGRHDPKLRMPKMAVPTLLKHAIEARWQGQDGSEGASLGDVHVALSGLPPARAIAAAALTDGVRGLWVFRASDRVKFDAGPFESPLNLRRGKGRGGADLFFSPYRDESKTTLTLRLVFQDGETALVAIPGGACDPTLSVPPIAATAATARPGDDLNDLANRVGTLTLAPGTYRLTRPLVLNQSVTLTGERGATLLFAQGATDPPWSAAIKIHRGRTTLRGFTVRFAGPVRWRPDVSYGAAIIGTTDNHDAIPPALKKGLTLTQLDIESPPSGKATGWEETPKLLRLINAGSGTIAGNVFRGGVIEFFGGPWQIVDNEFRGTPPATYSHGIIGGHYVSDVTVRGNRVKPVAPSGKVWRFVTFTNRGTHIRIEKNVVEGIGPRDDDTIPSMNAPEVVLTESYTLHFEGKVAALSPDGKIVRIPPAQNGMPYAGDVVSILEGPHAGEWRTIAHLLDPTTYLLDSPLPKGSDVVSVTSAFTDFVVAGNTIDSRGGKQSSNLVLAGNHFGTIVRDNRLAGGEAFRIQACATEAPVMWGWSHVPNLGAVIEGNIIEDSAQGGIFGVEHSQYTKANMGRTYMTATLRNNTVRWTEPYLRGVVKEGPKALPKGITIGYPGGLDPGELVVTEGGDRLQAPSGTPAGEAMRVNAALVNGRRTVKRGIVLPVVPGTAEVSRVPTSSSSR